MAVVRRHAVERIRARSSEPGGDSSATDSSATDSAAGTWAELKPRHVVVGRRNTVRGIRSLPAACLAGEPLAAEI